jgi:ribulose kinase
VDPDDRFVMGIDIGTTSVKVCLVDVSTRAVVAIQSKDTQGMKRKRLIIYILSSFWVKAKSLYWKPPIFIEE